ncbi:MAG TPA: asparagine synthase (glutamine-hydrolyzing), partial [Terriglobia bacterium]|nr:asparagine synthase (glutamine-hydrolyzing) [Terriglobia bacterium]
MQLQPLAHGERIDPMAATIFHRGPDSGGKFQLPHIALAIRRLSIIDLETGNQPLSDESGDITLVFNGEIYNYRELCHGLLDRGHYFKTHSDGEAIIHLYEELGSDCLRELNGMFAIALWDNRAQRLLLARDRAGEKPLYYWCDGETLVFGSEIKSLLEYPGISRAIDPTALAHYFFYGYFPSPNSIYTAIKKLPAGHRMVVEDGTLHIDAYWRPQEYLRPPWKPPVTAREERDLVEELAGYLRQAAESRLVSDVPLGVFLSGGVDSSTIVAIMSELSPGNISTFSVNFPEKTFNEEPYSALVAKRFRTQHHVLKADKPTMYQALMMLTEYLDEPMADPAVIPTYMISRFARDHIKVALSGEGSDELFGGYPTYMGARLADYYLKLPGVVRRQVFGRLKRFLPVSSTAVPKGLFLRRFLSHAEKNPAERHHIWFGMFNPTELDQLFSPDWAGPRPPSSVIYSPLARVLEGARFDETVSEMLYLDFRLYLEDNLLVKVDRASMACSLELRTPFLDHRLIEFAEGLPGQFKVRGFQLKYILKKAVERWLPKEIVYRQKRGFSVPIASWM